MTDEDPTWTPADEWRATARNYALGADIALAAAGRESDDALVARLARRGARLAERRADGEVGPDVDPARARLDDLLGRLADGEARAFDDTARGAARDAAHLAGGGSAGLLGDPDVRDADPAAVLEERVDALREALLPDPETVAPAAERPGPAAHEALARRRAVRAARSNPQAAQALVFRAGERLAEAAADRGRDVDAPLGAVDDALASVSAADAVDLRVAAPVTAADAVAEVGTVRDAAEVVAPVDGDRAVAALAAAEDVARGAGDPDGVTRALAGYDRERSADDEGRGGR